MAIQTSNVEAARRVSSCCCTAHLLRASVALFCSSKSSGFNTDCTALSQRPEGRSSASGAFTGQSPRALDRHPRSPIAPGRNASGLSSSGRWALVAFASETAKLLALDEGSPRTSELQVGAAGATVAFLTPMQPVLYYHFRLGWGL
jgi:hypothetical protein